MTDRASLESRRKQFAKELWDTHRYPDIEVRLHTYPNGETEEIPHESWPDARWFFSLPVCELLDEFLPSEVYDLQSLFRADGAGKLKGSMYAYWQLGSSDIQQVIPQCTSQAAFYGIGLDIYMSYIMKRSFIGLFAEAESYSENMWREYLKKVQFDPVGPENSTNGWRVRASYGASREADPMHLLTKLPVSNYRRLKEGDVQHFERLVRTHRNDATRLAQEIGLDTSRVVVEEISADTFIRDTDRLSKKRAAPDDDEESCSESSLEDVLLGVDE